MKIHIKNISVAKLVLCLFTKMQHCLSFYLENTSGKLCETIQIFIFISTLIKVQVICELSVQP